MRNKSLGSVTLRNIAIMFAKGLPVQGEAFGNKVNEYTEAIKRLPKSAKVALRSALIFSHKVPRQ
jgi:hypothetical protein